MDGSLPTSLKHIISNAEYYGPSLFLLGKFVVAHHKIVLGSTNTFFHIELLQGKKINIIRFTTNLMCCLLFSELSVCLLFLTWFSLLSLTFTATEVVTVFVFQEPSLLSSLQDNGLTDVMLHALLIKDVSIMLKCYLKAHIFSFRLVTWSKQFLIFALLNSSLLGEWAILYCNFYFHRLNKK